MPWIDVRPMDQKVLFIADFIRGGTNLSQLCRRYGISRKTGYKWIQRYQRDGTKALHEQSRAPHRQARQTPYVIEQAIIKLRQQGPIPMGPKKILVTLQQRFDPAELPSATTIYNILKRAGMVVPHRRRQPIPTTAQPFAPVNQPNELWSVDYKGQLALGAERWCYPLTVMDHHSRYLISCQGLSGTRLKATRQVFIKLFRRYGLPQRIRSDNGPPFASRAVGGLSRLSVWWIRLGIVPERIQAGKPQQNARHERMHRTLKSALRPATTMRAQQAQLDDFRQYYNQQRPHEALNQQPPVQHYQPSSRAYPKRLPTLEYPGYCQVRRVMHNGVVYWRGYQVYLSPVLEGERVGLLEVADGVWDVYVGPVRIGGFDVRQAKGNKVPYLSLKVLPV